MQPAQHAPQQPAEQHPEDADPLGNAHRRPDLSPEERRVTSLLIVALIAFLVCVPIIAVLSESPLVNVLVGLLPLFATIIIDLSLALRHYKVILFWLVLAVVHVIGLGVIWLSNLILAVPVNVSGSVSTSTVLAVVVTIIVMLADAKRVRTSIRDERAPAAEFKPEKIDEYVHAIEDKAKALNFVIGRVYRASNGGTAKMRERLRIPSDWYNEFNTLSGVDVITQLEKASVLLRKIRDRLALYTQRERDVFSHAELGGLKHIMRNKDGDDRVVDVLKANDRDPVEHYYVSAMDFCDRILGEIEEKKS
jgi:hypothetical protein